MSWFLGWMSQMELMTTSSALKRCVKKKKNNTSCKHLI